MSKRSLPSWEISPTADETVLKLYNSFTRQKEEFKPREGNHVLWYSCGPTVYDASHMGHARSYIAFDIMRRVLSKYFGYNILYVMNITDIDDKIIKKARQEHLYEDYLNLKHPPDKVLSDMEGCKKFLSKKVQKETDPAIKAIMEENLKKQTEMIKLLATQLEVPDPKNVENCVSYVLQTGKEWFAAYLDSIAGSSITQFNMFTTLSRKWEAAFLKDMEELNVLPPDVLTRVSEYIPEIIEYILKIMDNGLAYESNGSVYFDVAAFDASENHVYAKLVPEAYGDTKSLEEGEGALHMQNDLAKEKKNPNDFALWKNSKSGEPWWQSPWGKGRPGWHIECSVMASAICGSHIDIHTGGVDLKFPHHDNELAQAEAYFDSNEWVRYFLHSGHLTISGCKMSKSLKNFVTVKDALKKYSARQLRIAFLLHSWKDTIDYAGKTMCMVMQFEKLLNEFFLNMKDACRRKGVRSCPEDFEKWSESEISLNRKFLAAQKDIHTALCDNIDTRAVCDLIRNLIAFCNIYVRDHNSPNKMLLRRIAKYITDLFTMFGVINSKDEIGFTGQNVGEPSCREEMLMPYLNILADFRTKVRTEAKKIGANTLLTECDVLRDEILPNFGVRLEDQEGRPSAVKLVDREFLLKERESKMQAEKQKQADKERRKQELAAAEALKEAQKKIPPSEMFKSETDKYSKFNDEGLPTHGADGQEISKGQLKKLMKLQQQQEKRYKEYLESQAKSTQN